MQPSTHIFKPGYPAAARLDVTEHITLQVARLLGIDAAASVIAEFDGEHVLIVERSTASTTTAPSAGCHQEDLAQATGSSHIQKYESDGGPGCQDIFTVFDRNLSASHQGRRSGSRAARLLLDHRSQRWPLQELLPHACAQ